MSATGPSLWRNCHCSLPCRPTQRIRHARRYKGEPTRAISRSTVTTTRVQRTTHAGVHVASPRPHYQHDADQRRLSNNHLDEWSQHRTMYMYCDVKRSGRHKLRIVPKGNFFPEVHGQSKTLSNSSTPGTHFSVRRLASKRVSKCVSQQGGGMVNTHGSNNINNEEGKSRKCVKDG